MRKKIELGRRKFLAGAAGVAAVSVLGFPAITRAQNSTLVVNSYGGSFEKFFRAEIVPAFEKDTGIKLTVDISLGKGWLTTLRAAGPDNPPYDVLMTNETWASIEREEGFFEPIPVSQVPNMSDLHPIARLKDDSGVIAFLTPIGLAYRNDIVNNPPTSWTDLWTNPEFRGKSGMYTITNSAGYMFVLMSAKVFGGSEYNTDAAFEKIKELRPFNQVDFSGTMETFLTRGEVIVGILDSAAVTRLSLKGEKLSWIAPKEGVFMFEQVFNVLKGSKKKELAYQWINWQLSPETQLKWANGFFWSPVNVKTELSDDLKALIPIHGDEMGKIILWDWKTANANRDKVIERWNKEMR